MNSSSLLSTARNAERKVAPNQRLFVAVKIPGFIRAVVDIALKFIPGLRDKMRHASTLDGARAIIRAHREELEAGMSTPVGIGTR